MRNNLLSEVTTELDGTADLLELGEESNAVKTSVVGDEEATSNLGKLGEGHVLEETVADERDITSLGLGQVGGAEAGEVVGVELGRAVDHLQGRHGELGDVGNSHVGDPVEVGEVNLKVNAVGLDDELIRQIRELRGVLLQAAVVVDVERANRLESEPVQRAEESVADANGLGLGQWAERDGVQAGRGHPVDRLNRGELPEVNRVEPGHLVELELAADGLEGRAHQGGDLLVLLNPQVTGDLLRARDINGSTALGTNNQVTLHDLAARQLARIGLAVDGGTLAGAGLG